MFCQVFSITVPSKVAPVEWDVPISVFGVTVRPGQLIHADQHGFLVIPEEDEEKLEEATSFMDRQLLMFSHLDVHFLSSHPFS